MTCRSSIVSVQVVGTSGMDQPLGHVTETLHVTAPELGTVTCRSRKKGASSVKTYELSEEALSILGFNFRCYKSRGVTKFNIETK